MVKIIINISRLFILLSVIVTVSTCSSPTLQAPVIPVSGDFAPTNTSEVFLTPTLEDIPSVNETPTPEIVDTSLTSQPPDEIPQVGVTAEAQPTPPKILFLPLILRAAQTYSCPCYFVDSILGSDTNSGTEVNKPWKTLSKLSTTSFVPGTTIYLKRGSVWSGTITISVSGQSGKPILFTSYGDGPAPKINNLSTSPYPSRAILIRGDWIIIDGLHIEGAKTGIEVTRGADHNIVQNNEINSVGIGIELSGQYNHATRNYVHDLHMVVNTVGGSDDYGALGVDILNSYNEVSSNRFYNCEAPSYDFGVDGGAVEIYQMGDYTNVHHNWSMNSEGFMEVSSNGSGSAKNVTIAYNVIINSTGLNVIHVGDDAATQIANFRVENNTFVDLRTHDPLQGNVIWFGGTPVAGTYIFRNNIIYLKDYWWVSRTSGAFIHENNLYYFTNSSTKLGFSVGQGEFFADPLFVNLGDMDFHLTSSSPAIDRGLYLGYSQDFDRQIVPYQNVPDIGAYEYQGN